MYSLALPALAAAILPSALAAPQGMPAHAGVRQGHHEVDYYHDTQTPYMTAPYVPDWAEGVTREYEIHKSCNSTQTSILRQALTETEILAGHARDHIQRFGNGSSFYKKYFGSAPSAEPAGWYDRLVNGDKTGVLFRCDDPDMNCATQEDWAGHWRGSNATEETVICELSYTSRWNLNALCGYGYTVAGGELASYFASDLIHRLFHTNQMGEGTVFHYADTYQECLALAMEAPEEAVRNAHTLQYFALDVYAADISVPGQGCTGEPMPEEEEETADSTTTESAATSASTEAMTMETTTMETTSSAEATTTVEPTSTIDDEESTTESATESAESNCHTHAGGELHCIEA